MVQALRGQGSAEELTDAADRDAEPLPNAGAPFVRTAGLRKRFGPFTALDGIDLEVGRGEFVCFLGPSGCGKTTLLRTIAGLEQQDEGHIEIGGRDVSRAKPAERDFGIVFQSYALFPNLTVAQNVGYGLANKRTPRRAADARVAELLEFVGIPSQAASTRPNSRGASSNASRWLARSRPRPICSSSMSRCPPSTPRSG
jgi:ABC-type Fe3+/spermidine/putrescine transport system ATPase subunit